MQDEKKSNAIQPSDRPVSQRESPIVRDLLERGRRQLERLRTAEDAFGKGVLELHEKRYAAAIAQFQAALKTHPDHAEARYYLGVAYLMTGEYAQAVEAYSAAIRSGYNAPQAAQSLADALFLAERYAEAAEAYATVVQARPSAEAYARMAQALTFLGRREDAIAAYKQALLAKLSGGGVTE